MSFVFIFSCYAGIKLLQTEKIYANKYIFDASFKWKANLGLRPSLRVNPTRWVHFLRVDAFDISHTLTPL